MGTELYFIELGAFTEDDQNTYDEDHPKRTIYWHDETEGHSHLIDYTDIELNNKYMFFWNDDNVTFLPIEQVLKPRQFHHKPTSLNVKISSTDKFMRVYCGQNDNVVAITIKTQQTVVFLVWNVRENVELNYLEIKEPHFVTFGPNGNPYLIDNEEVYFSRQ